MKGHFIVTILLLGTLISFTNCQVFRKSHKHKRVTSSTTTTTAATITEPVPPPPKPLIEEGKYYVVGNIASGKVLTVEGTNFTRNANVIVAEWNDETSSSQTWLGLKSSKHSKSSRFVLIPSRQVYSNPNSHEYINFTSLGNLPQQTEVLTLDSITGNLTTEAYQHGLSSQEWVIEDGKSGQILIRNLGNNQCIKNFDYKAANIFQKIASFISRLRKPYKAKPGPNPLSTLDCSHADITQKWFLELFSQQKL